MSMTMPPLAKGEPVPEQMQLMERVVERSNMQAAYKRVRQNKGAPGIDGMSVNRWPLELGEDRAQLPCFDSPVHDEALLQDDAVAVLRCLAQAVSVVGPQPRSNLHAALPAG